MRRLACNICRIGVGAAEALAATVAGSAIASDAATRRRNTGVGDNLMYLGGGARARACVCGGGGGSTWVFL